MIRPRPQALVLGLLTLLAAGCQKEAQPELKQFGSCTELEDRIKDLAMQQASWSETSAIRDWGCIGCEVSVMAADMGMAEGAPGGMAATNVQEVAVNEADFVKNDSGHLYMVSGTDLVIVKAVPANDMREVARLPIEGHRGRIFAGENVLLVVSELWGEQGVTEQGTTVELDENLVKLTWVDISERTAPVVSRELYMEGDLNTTRVVDNRVYVVSERWLRGPQSAQGSLSVTGMVRDSVLTDWLPRRENHQRTATGWDVRSETLTDCSLVYEPANPAGTVLTSITSFDVSAPDSPAEGIAVLAPADLVYMSGEHLYLGVKEPDWGPFGDRNNQLSTRIHRFDIQGAPPAPPYEISGQVNGYALDSFSMAEYDGSLQVATTEFGNSGAENAIYVLADPRTDGQEDEGGLIEVGSVIGFGPGELITSARFDEDKGYVSTFLQVDPLFTFDLSDATNPRLMGELEMPGSNTYLHPMGETHLIGVGQAGTWDGLTGGVQVSLFDVSDLSNPRQVDHEDITSDWVETDALWDTHAITYYPAFGTLSVPVVSWDWSGGEVSSSVLRVYRPTEAGLGFLGEIDHRDFRVEGNEYGNGFCSQVRRSVYIGGDIYAISSLGVKAASLDNLNEVKGSLQYSTEADCLNHLEDNSRGW